MARRSKRGSRTKKPDKYAKQKLFAIPVLLAILGYVLLENVADNSQDDSVAVAPAGLNRVPAGGSGGSAEQEIVPSRQLPAWPEPTLDFLAGPSPLASYREVAGEVVRPVPENGKTMLVRQQVSKQREITSSIRRQLSSQDSQFVFKSANRKLALVGDRIIEQGEQLESGVRLRDVRGNNLVIEVGRRID